MSDAKKLVEAWIYADNGYPDKRERARRADEELLAARGARKEATAALAQLLPEGDLPAERCFHAGYPEHGSGVMVLRVTRVAVGEDSTRVRVELLHAERPE